MQLQFKFLPKVYIPSERDVLTEILSNVSILERPIDVLTSWFDIFIREGPEVDTSDPDFMPLYNSAIVQSFS